MLSSPSVKRAGHWASGLLASAVRVNVDPHNLNFGPSSFPEPSDSESFSLFSLQRQHMSQSNFLLDSHTGVANTSISFESDTLQNSHSEKSQGTHPSWRPKSRMLVLNEERSMVMDYLLSPVLLWKLTNKRNQSVSQIYFIRTM